MTGRCSYVSVVGGDQVAPSEHYRRVFAGTLQRADSCEEIMRIRGRRLVLEFPGKAGPGQHSKDKRWV